MITKKDICIGLFVEIIQYNERNNETIHRGYIQRIITQGKSDKVKVELHNGECGVVIHILSKEELQLEAFKFYNKFLFSKEIYAIWHRYEQSYYVGITPNEHVLYLFSTKETANKFLAMLKNNDCMVKEIKCQKTKYLNDYFKKETYDSFYIDLERKIKKEKLHKFEYDLKRK